MDDNSKKFQFLIDVIGYSTILQYFSTFLGLPKCAIFIRDENTRATRTLRVPIDFNGLGFDGAHWKAYKNGKLTFESYKEKVQQQHTNNYCQSFACFMLASDGLVNGKHNVTLEKGKYTDNIMKISKLWVECLKNLNKKQKTQILKCIKQLKSGMKFKDLLCILEKLGSDEMYALEFASSKE